MKRFFCIILLGILYSLITVYASEPTYQASKKERFKQYIAGIKYLESATTLAQEEKGSYYRKLVALTGFTAETAHAYAKKYEDTPEKWIKLIDSVLARVTAPVNESVDSLKKEEKE